MSSEQRPPGAALLGRLEQDLAQSLAHVPAALIEAAARSRHAMQEHARAMEAARERIAAGARHTKHRFCLDLLRVNAARAASHGRRPTDKALIA